MLAPAFPMLFSCAGPTILRFSMIAEGLGTQCGPRRLTDVYFGEDAYVVVTPVGSVNAHRSRLRCAVGGVRLVTALISPYCVLHWSR